MHEFSEVVSEAVEILEPNLQFYRESRDDKARYSLGPSVLQALGWIATSIALPILLSGASEVVKTRVKEWLEKRKEGAGTAALSKEVAYEVNEVLTAGVTDHCKQQAIAAVASFLSDRGWPNAFAEADAADIVAAIERSASRKRD